MQQQRAVVFRQPRFCTDKKELENAMKLKITQVRSSIGALKKHKETIKALGLGRPNYTVIQPKNPQILGMVNAVRHLVRVEETAE
jgi:large subunit ribosomal protein L30